MEEAYIVSDDTQCSPNLTMFQGYEWYIPEDHPAQHWKHLTTAIPGLAMLGITSMWIPPACKASWVTGSGYDLYDLYDLGEFEQRGGKHTKWGTKEELIQLTNTAKSYGIGILFDVVLNHRTGADHTETVLAVKVDPEGDSSLSVLMWTLGNG